MKTKKFSYRDNLGLILLAVGAGLWLLPFVVVAAENLVGSTKPADYLIGNLGALILTVSPLLIVTGLILTLVKFLKR